MFLAAPGRSSIVRTRCLAAGLAVVAVACSSARYLLRTHLLCAGAVRPASETRSIVCNNFVGTEHEEMDAAARMRPATSCDQRNVEITEVHTDQ